MLGYDFRPSCLFLMMYVYEWRQPAIRILRWMLRRRRLVSMSDCAVQTILEGNWWDLNDVVLLALADVAAYHDVCTVISDRHCDDSV